MGVTSALRTILERTGGLAGGLAGCLGIFGCEDLRNSLEDEVQERVEAQRRDDISKVKSPSSDAPRAEQLASKLEIHLACLGRSRKRLAGAWDRYAEDVDPERGVPRRKSTKPFVPEIENELQPCRVAVQRGPKMPPPRPELEAAMSRYLETAEAMAELTRTLHAYYGEAAYETDRWAKSKELGPKFAAAHQAWEDAATELSELLRTAKDETDRAMLSVIEEREGKVLRWHVQNLMVAATDFVRCAQESDGGVRGRCAEPHARLRKAHAGFTKSHDADPEAASAVFWMSAFVGRADDLLEQAQALMSSDGRGAKAGLQGELERLASRYDDLVSAANNLRFDFPTAG